MDWKQLGSNLLSKGLPLLGAAVGGPAGGTIGMLLGNLFGVSKEDPEAIYQAIQQDPEAIVKLRQFEMQHKERLAEIALDRAKLDSEQAITQIREVNATMREEAKSEHWPQYSWRPFNGFVYPIAVICIYFILPLADVTVPDVPEWIWLGWGAILGVTTWHRGVEKRNGKPGTIENVINAIKR